MLKSLPTQAKFHIQMPHPNTIFIAQFSILCVFQNLATFLVLLFGFCLWASLQCKNVLLNHLLIKADSQTLTFLCIPLVLIPHSTQARFKFPMHTPQSNAWGMWEGGGGGLKLCIDRCITRPNRPRGKYLDQEPNYPAMRHNVTMLLKIWNGECKYWRKQIPEHGRLLPFDSNSLPA